MDFFILKNWFKIFKQRIEIFMWIDLFPSTLNGCIVNDQVDRISAIMVYEHCLWTIWLIESNNWWIDITWDIY